MADGDNRRARRGSQRTPARPVSTTVSYEDPVPPGDRYNLAFSSEYDLNNTDDQFLRTVDRRFFEWYHSRLPDMLNSSAPWSGKTPASRTTCKCDVVSEVSSLLDLVQKLTDFFQRRAADKKKIGTIFISAHGSARTVALPISRGAPIVTVEELGRGLAVAGNLPANAPQGFAQARWEQLRGPLHQVANALISLHRASNGWEWFDEQSMIRFWLCNVGQPPPAGAPDAMTTFARTLVPSNPLIVEGPTVRSLGGYQMFSSGTSDGALWRGLRGGGRRREYLHPDMVSEVESDQHAQRFTGDDLRDSHEYFISRFRSSSSLPGVSGSGSWVPVFGLESRSNRPVYPGQWRQFKALWRRETLPRVP